MQGRAHFSSDGGTPSPVLREEGGSLGESEEIFQHNMPKVESKGMFIRKKVTFHRQSVFSSQTEHERNGSRKVWKDSE